MSSSQSADPMHDAASTGNGSSPVAVVREAAGTVAARLPEAAAQTRAAVDQAARRIETGSDEMLTAGTTLSLGVAIGMLVGGAPRILVALALIPAAAMGMTLLDRNGRASKTPRLPG